MAKAVFLDRDGVLNKALVQEGRPYPPKDLNAVKIIDGVAEALASLKAAGWMLIVITNQPDVARGKTSKEAVESINSYLAHSLPIDHFYTCYHDSIDNCECRKPSAGSFFKAKSDYGINLDNCYMVGDRWVDMQAGRLAGCKTIFINYGYSEKQPEYCDYEVKSLLEASKIIFGESA